MSKMKRIVYNDEQLGKEINLKEYWDVIKGRIWIVFAMVIFAVGAAYAYSYMNNTPLYDTSTRMILSTEDENMNTLMVMIKDPIIMEQVKSDLNLEQSSEGLANQIEVNRLEDSEVIQISVTANDPELAASIANKTAEVYKNEIVNILEFEQVQLLSKAEVNPYPNNEFQDRNLVIAGVFGIIAGIGLIFLLDTLDGAVKTREEVEDFLGIPVLGFVSPMNRKNSTTKKKKNKGQEVEVRGESVDIK
ncbi:YveK family protein [Halobacillus sp. A5]|uniref:YveK family protein n=1 Tax=Halobacillus sp. A5 TaxID=2880263 RepID=UPI0020A660E3|nr:Wzz/FepE/Etk N-terminal domain-containing protein [Halobacillus sp. A5]MCP3029208.1 capsular biosynthesis protein [Halobacillus sp. A5]